MYNFKEVKKTKTKVDYHAIFSILCNINTAIRLNITKLVLILVIPCYCHKCDDFSSRGIMLVDSSLILVIAMQQTFKDPSIADWAKVASKIYNLATKWGKGDYKTF